MKVTEDTSGQDHLENEDVDLLRTIVVQMKSDIDLHHLALPKGNLIRIEKNDVRERILLNTVEMTNNSNVNEKDTIVTVPTKRTRNIEEKDIVLPIVKNKQIPEVRIREDEEGTTRVTLKKKI